MANLVLQPTVAVEIDNLPQVTVYDFSLTGDRPVTVRYGAQGPIGSAKGQEKVSGSMKFAVPTTGPEMDVRAKMAANGGFSLSFSLGTERYSVYGCQVTRRGVTNNPEAGSTDLSVDFTATEWVRTA